MAIAQMISVAFSFVLHAPSLGRQLSPPSPDHLIVSTSVVLLPARKSVTLRPCTSPLPPHHTHGAAFLGTAAAPPPPISGPGDPTEVARSETGVTPRADATVGRFVTRCHLVSFGVM